MHDFAKECWDVFYNQDEGVLSSGEYVWNATMWSYAYALINQCNMAIDLLDKAEADGQPDVVPGRFKE